MLIGQTVAGLGYEFVTLEMAGRGLLRVYIDKPGGVVLDDCARVSNQLTRVFAVEDVPYDRLEVSSPGLDRPLVKEADFVRFAGERVQVRLRLPMAGRKKYVGMLRGLEEGALHLETESGPVVLALADVESARLVPQV